MLSQQKPNKNNQTVKLLIQLYMLNDQTIIKKKKNRIKLKIKCQFIEFEKK